MPLPRTDVCIVGAGPGGLAAAIAVRRAAPQLAVTVVERAAALAPRGALVAVVPNGIKALAAIDPPLATTVLDLAVDVAGTRIESAAGAVLSHTTGKRADRTAHLGPSSTVLWSALRDALAGAAVEAGANIVLGTPLRGVTWQEDGSPALEFESADGTSTTVQPALAIGADGASSVFRRCMLPADPAAEFAGTAVWRGATPTPAGWDPDAAGWRLVRGQRAFMIVYSRARPGHVVWQLFCGAWPADRVGDLASVGHMSGDRRAGVAPADCTARAVQVLRDDGWPDAWQALVAGAADDSVAEHPLLFRRPHACRTWHRGAALLIGDAAHLATPVLGQGTSSAFEDALALGRAVKQHGASAAAAAACEAARVDRATAIQGMSVALYGKQQAGEPFDEIGEHLRAGWMEVEFEPLVQL